MAQKGVGMAANPLTGAAKGAMRFKDRAAGKVRWFTKQYFEEDFESDGFDSREYDSLLTAVGTHELAIAVRSIHIQKVDIPAGSAIVWKVRVKKYDIGFGVKEIIGNKEIEIQPVVQHNEKVVMKGHLGASEKSRNIAFVFDNSSSQLHRKSIAYWISVGPDVTHLEEEVESARTKEFAAAEEGPRED